MIEIFKFDTNLAACFKILYLRRVKFTVFTGNRNPLAAIVTEENKKYQKKLLWSAMRTPATRPAKEKSVIKS